uniref:Nucleoporin SEH1 n=1 Tax=Lygus hesperus TaxID=30085 RepID=A0A0A9XBA1_LYGHE
MFISHSVSTDHKDLIHDVAFDHYGKRMATCSSDQFIKVWEMDSDNVIDGGWKLSATWKAHSGSVWKVTWAHPEFGQVLASCSFDRTAAVWEEIVSEPNIYAQTGQKHWAKRTTLVDSRTSVMDIKFAPKSMGLLLATCSADGIIRIYEAPDVMNLAQWTLQQEVPCKYQASCISWNPSYTRERRCVKKAFTKIQNSEKKDAEERSEYDGSEENPMKFPFHVDKSDKYIVIPEVPMLAVGSDETSSTANSSRVVILHYSSYVRRWHKLESVPSVADPVHDITFAPRLGRSYDILAVATKDIKLFTICQLIGTTGTSRFEVTPFATLEDHNSTVWRVSWNSVGNVLASSGDDGCVRIWRLNKQTTWKCVGTIKGDGRRLILPEVINGGMALAKH